MMRVLRRATAYLVAAACVAGAQAPTPITLNVAPSCATCTIRFEREVTLGDTIGPGRFPRHTVSLDRDSRGRFLVASKGRAMVFDTAGRFVSDIGTGPDELRSANEVFFGRGDTMFVTERSYFSAFAPDGQFLFRTQTGLLGGSMGVLANGRIFHATRNMVAPTIRLATVTLLGPTAQVVRTVRWSEAVPTAAMPDVYSKVSASRLGLMWTATAGRYEFALVDTGGTVVRVLTGTRPWFTASTDYDSPTSVGDIHEDANGFLWVIGLVAAPGWRAKIPTDPTGVDLGAISMAGLRNTIVEVIDLRTNQLVTSARLPGFTVRFVGGGRIAVLKETATGVQQTEIWRVRLDGYSR
jgi:hypothetical protein